MIQPFDFDYKKYRCTISTFTTEYYTLVEHLLFDIKFQTFQVSLVDFV